MKRVKSPDEAVLPETIEETGLVELHLARHLGSDERVISNNGGNVELNLRHFYHLICEPDVPDSWVHDELHPSDGSPDPITLEFYWLTVSDAAESLHPYYVTNLDKLSGNLPNHRLE